VFEVTEFWSSGNLILFGHKTSPSYWSGTAATEVHVTFMQVGFEFDRLHTKDRKVVRYCGALHGTDTHEVGLHF
jgi:hypothetical protein